MKTSPNDAGLVPGDVLQCLHSCGLYGYRNDSIPDDEYLEKGEVFIYIGPQRVFARGKFWTVYSALVPKHWKLVRDDENV